MRTLACVLGLAAAAAAATAATSSCDLVGAHDGLLVVDVQNCFMERFPIPDDQQPAYPVPDHHQELEGGQRFVKGGALAVAGTADVVAAVQQWIDAFEDKGATVMFSLDWHPEGHCSFCRNGSGATRAVCGPLGPATRGFDSTGRCEDARSQMDWNRGAYMQWPDHCVQNQFGSRFPPFLRVPDSAVVVKKGFDATKDSYSAFRGRLSNTPAPFWDGNDTAHALASQPDLPLLLAQRDVRRLFTVGIATDYCVGMSTLDALAWLGVGDVVMVQGATRAVTAEGKDRMVREVREAGGIVPPDHAVSPADVLRFVCREGEGNGTGEGRGDGEGFGVSTVAVLTLFVVLFAVSTLLLGGLYLRQRATVARAFQGLE